MKEKILVISFISILFLFFGIGLITKDKNISLVERRNLITREDLKKDPFKNLESYLNDQFPLRNTLISLYSLVDRLILGNKENNNIYIKDNVLIEKNYPLNEKSISTFSAKINTITSQYVKNGKVFYAIIPDKSYFLEYNNYQKLDFIKMYNQLEKEINIPNINITNLFQLNNYFKTDIHLKQDAYFEVVKELGKYFNFKTLDMPFAKQTYDNFHGSSYAKGSFFSHPEELFYYTNKWTKSASAWHLEYGTKEIYDEEKLGSLDSYSLFLSGPSSFIEINSPNALTNKELIIFRDSFGSSLAPLLLPYFQKIILIDLRYISMEMVEKYVSFENKDILFLYSTLLVNESNLLKVKVK